MRGGWLRRSQKKDEGPPVNCQYRLTSEHGRVLATFGCRACPAEGDLRSATCYSEVLKAFGREVQIDALVLADVQHRMYTGGLVEVFREQSDLQRVAERAGLRPGDAADLKDAKCKSCDARPGVLFLPIAEALGRQPRDRDGNVATFDGFEDIQEAAERVRSMSPPEHHDACAGCLQESKDAAAHLAEAVSETRGRLTLLAYRAPGEQA